MIYKGTSFNMKFVLEDFNNAEQFAEHPSNRELWPSLSEEERHKRLITFYNLATNANDKQSIAVEPKRELVGSNTVLAGTNGTGSDTGTTTTTEIGPAE